MSLCYVYNSQVQVSKYLVNQYKKKKDIVILSSYRDQRSKIAKKLKGAYEDIEVTTVTKSQGKISSAQSQLDAAHFRTDI